MADPAAPGPAPKRFPGRDAIAAVRVECEPLEAGVELEGVTRRFVMDTLCRDCKVTCEEKMMRLDEVLGADEVFLTGTAAEIIAVHSVGDFRISDGEGPITRKLRTRFREIVTSDHIPED